MPGQEVWPTSRWPETVRIERPFTDVFASADTPEADSFQAIAWLTASSVFCGGADFSYVPMTEMPNVPVL